MRYNKLGNEKWEQNPGVKTVNEKRKPSDLFVYSHDGKTNIL